MRSRQRSYLSTKHGYQSLEPRRLLAALANGQEVIDNVLVGQTKIYQLEITTPGQVYVSVGETFDFDADIELQVNSPSAAFGEFSLGDVSAGVQFFAEELGTYQIIVNDIERDHGFQFRIRALAVNQPFDLIEGRDQLLANGEEFNASLPVGSLGVYQFAVNTEDPDGARVALEGSFFESQPPIFSQNFPINVSVAEADIFGPDGNILLEGQSLDTGFVASRFGDGLHTVVVNNDFFERDFRFRSFVFGESFETIPERDALIANGEETIVNVPIGATNVIEFDLEAQQEACLLYTSPSPRDRG